MKISNITKFITGMAIHHLYFWGAVAIAYLVSKEFTLTQAYAFLGFYSICVVLLEYPTGVIADKFGHRVSVGIGQLIIALGLGITILDLPVGVYYFAAMLMALGTALESGSDQAYLKTHAPDFKKTYSNYQSLLLFMMFIAPTIGGLLAGIELRVPVILSVLSSLISGIIILSIKERKEVSETKDKNFLQIAKEGAKTTFTHLPILTIVLFAAMINGYVGSVKTIASSFTEVFDINITFVGTLVGLTLLVRSIGSKLENKFEKVPTLLLVGLMILIFFLQLLPIPVYAIIGLMLLINFIGAMVIIRMSDELNKAVPDSIRASVLSIQGLLNRLGTSLYLALTGYILEILSFQVLMLITGIIFSIGVIAYIILKRKIAKK